MTAKIEIDPNAIALLTVKSKLAIERSLF